MADLISRATKPMKESVLIRKYDYCDDEYWECAVCHEKLYFGVPLSPALNYYHECGTDTAEGRTDENN